MGSMMALRAHAQGGPEVLVYEPAPRPVPGPGEMPVSVHAAVITFDVLSRAETWSVGGVDRTPVIPPHEFCGVVAPTFPLAEGQAAYESGAVRRLRPGKTVQAVRF